MLQGKKVDKTKLGGTNGLSFVLPVPVTVTKDNFAAGLRQYVQRQAASYLLDGIMTNQDVQQFFAK